MEEQRKDTSKMFQLREGITSGEKDIDLDKKIKMTEKSCNNCIHWVVCKWKREFEKFIDGNTVGGYADMMDTGKIWLASKCTNYERWREKDERTDK